MNDLEILDQINKLLDDDDPATVNTSMRLPRNLRDAATLAVDHLGTAASATMLTAEALRYSLETAVMEATLQAHYQQHPHARPTLAETALAMAEQDGSPLATQPAKINQAAQEIAVRFPHADAEAVLIWAEARETMSA